MTRKVTTDVHWVCPTCGASLITCVPLAEDPICSCPKRVTKTGTRMVKKGSTK